MNAAPPKREWVGLTKGEERLKLRPYQDTAADFLTKLIALWC